MGEGMVNNLLKGGRQVVVWNRSQDKCEAFKQAHGDGITIASSPREVVEAVDLTYRSAVQPVLR